jgi:hypothetical protein
MPGPTPGPHSEQRTVDAGWVTLPAAGRGGPAPTVSLAGAGLPAAVQRRARELWAIWWGSPMALMWSDFDVPQLERLLVLTARSWDGESAAGLSEVRQLEDRFGLSPVARRKLYWRIEGVDLPSTVAADLGGVQGQRSVLPTAGGEADPRLRVVKGGKAAG